VCGVALKPLIGPMAKLAGSALLMPAGSIAGAVYMMWPLLALLVVRRFGAAAFMGMLESIIVIVTGFYGSHGFVSVVTYVLPCLVIDLVFLLIPNKRHAGWLALPSGLGNATGAMLVGVLIMRLPLAPLATSLGASLVFGAVGGLLALALYRLLIQTFPQFRKDH